jgi:hypothetical protein
LLSTCEFSSHVKEPSRLTNIITSLYPETKGPTIEELGDLFEKTDPLGKGGMMDLERYDSDSVVRGKNGATYIESTELKA